METGIANLLGALSLAVMDRIEQAAGAAARKDLLVSRIAAVASLLDVMSPAETKRLGTLIRELLGRQDTSEQDRFTICRMCDDPVCTNCPLPTTKSKRDR